MKYLVTIDRTQRATVLVEVEGRYVDRYTLRDAIMEAVDLLDDIEPDFTTSWDYVEAEEA